MEAHVKVRFGFTLIEMMLTILIATLVFVAIGVAMVDSIKSFPVMNERAQGSVVTDAYVAKATFDRICRQASIAANVPLVGINGSDVEVYYYSNPGDMSLTKPDQYARFYVSGNQLLVEKGAYPKNGSATVEVLANTADTNVLPTFGVQGTSVTMVLNLRKSDQTMVVTSAAVRHNE
jgi:prepilin-type N-terminal cleavage/methylation domain-containing protein